MDQLQKTLSNAQKIVVLAKKEGWSEDEFARVIKLLHSNIAFTMDGQAVTDIKLNEDFVKALIKSINEYQRKRRPNGLTVI